MTPPTYEHLTAAQTPTALPDLQGVYDAVFSEPPYLEDDKTRARFGEWLTRDADRPGFDMYIAQIDMFIVGFAYGYTMTGWWKGAAHPEPGDLQGVDKFAVIEWAVLPEYRGAGIGRRLLDELLAGRPEPLATLTVNPAAPARRVYERWGWMQVDTTTPAGMPTMDVMVRKLDRPTP